MQSRSGRRKSTPAPDPRAIIRRRGDCVREIERLENEPGAPVPFVEKARHLLRPRFWAGADWRTRAELLTAVEWLLRLNGRAATVGATASAHSADLTQPI
jgi:hypothetical protein